MTESHEPAHEESAAEVCVQQKKTIKKKKKQKLFRPITLKYTYCGKRETASVMDFSRFRTRDVRNSSASSCVMSSEGRGEMATDNANVAVGNVA